jgi:hypothetical protein
MDSREAEQVQDRLLCYTCLKGTPFCSILLCWPKGCADSQLKNTYNPVLSVESVLHTSPELEFLT